MRTGRAIRCSGVLAALLLCGCAAGVRDLGRGEQQYLAALRAGVEENQEAIERAIGDIGDIQEDAAIAEQRHLLGALAKAKLLESLRSPWAAPSDAMRETQRAVVLYYLYDLAQTEQRAFEAAAAERAARRSQVARRWARIGEVLGEALASEERILRDLDQPPDQQVAIVVGHLLERARALRGELGKADDPELARIAAAAEKAMSKVEAGEDKLTRVLELMRRLEAGRSGGGR